MCKLCILQMNDGGVCVSRPLLGPEASEAGPIPPPLGRHLLRTSWAHVHVDHNISSVVVTTGGLRPASSSPSYLLPPPPLLQYRVKEDTPRKRRFGGKPFLLFLRVIFFFGQIIKKGTLRRCYWVVNKGWGEIAGEEASRLLCCYLRKSGEHTSQAQFC